MIIARSPLRISLGGGGTDLPSYYKKKNGFVLSAAINKYVYVTITRPFQTGIYLKYSSIEKVKKVSDIKHRIIKSFLERENFTDNRIEISTLADIPSGTGLGSSGSFTSALIKSYYMYKQKMIDQKELARIACEIEIQRLKDPVGKQDQYISALGGVTCFEFQKNDNVKAYPLKLSSEKLKSLSENLVLFFTGVTREAKSVLLNQKKLSIKNNKMMINNLDEIKQMGKNIKKYLENNDFESFGLMMNEHWQKKKKRSSIMSNEKINFLYDSALKNGAVGGKLVGAGGGFLMFYCENKKKLINYFSKHNILPVEFNFDFEGTKIIMN